MERYDRGPERLGNTERDFKVCDLCGALNPAANGECFVCGWSGQFHTDKEPVREAMNEAEDKYGSLNQSLFAEEILPSTPPRAGFWAGVWESVRRRLGRA